MRPLIATLVLLAGAASQLSALDCAMRAPAGAAEAATMPGAEAHGHDQHHAHDAEGAPAPAAPHHSDTNCRLLVTCAGAVPTDGAPALVREAGLSTMSPLAAADESRAGVFPAQEPPPPRLPV